MTKIARNVGKPRDWIRGVGRYPNANEAAYVAQLLGVPMQRLVNPKGEFNPNAVPIRPMKPRSEWNVKVKPGPKIGAKPKAKHKANGHDPDDDRRWTRPEGIEPTNVKLETHKKIDGFMTINITGACPTDVGLTVMAMLKSKSANE